MPTGSNLHRRRIIVNNVEDVSTSSRKYEENNNDENHEEGSSNSNHSDDHSHCHHQNVSGGNKTSAKVNRTPTYILLGVATIYMTSLYIITGGKLRKRPSERDDESNVMMNGFNDIQKRRLKSKCEIWIAPSSLKGVDGYGIFTTRDIPEGHSILGNHDGVSIPVENYPFYPEGPSKQSVERDAFIRLFDNYWWGRGVPDHVEYEAPLNVIDYQIGHGSLPNHHCFFDVLTYRIMPYQDGMLDRYHDPGVGAFSYNLGREYTTNTFVPAGSELFLNYGYCDRETTETESQKSGQEWMQYIYTDEDFHEATIILEQQSMLGKSVLKYSDETGMLEKYPDELHPRVFDLLPKTLDDYKTLVKGVDNQGDLIDRIAKSSLLVRKPEFIRENGICMENIVPGRSTIHNAGQGAFAQFHLSKGDIVAPVPLMQILDKKALEIYQADDYEDGPVEYKGIQLLINYCFGHPESSLLLCPNTNAVLVNHCSNRKSDICGPSEKGPNAEIRWSSGWDPTSEKWRAFTFDKLLKQNNRGLAFEIVALRDIQPREEIFIDYGIEWETAWLEHVQNWKPPEKFSSSPFLTAQKANENETDPILEDFISGDLRQNVEHPHLFTGCRYYKSFKDRLNTYTELIKNRSHWTEWEDQEVIDYYGGDGRFYRWNEHHQNYTTHEDHTYWPCSVLKQQDDGKYIVRIHQAHFEEEMPWEENDLPRILYDYSRDKIHYFVNPYHSDQHLPNTFRHPLGIPDSMFPKQWRFSRQKLIN